MKSFAQCDILSECSNDMLYFHRSQVDDTELSSTVLASPVRRSALTKNGLENQFTLSAPLFPASHSR